MSPLSIRIRTTLQRLSPSLSGLLSSWAILSSASAAPVEIPKAADERLTVELVAIEPEVRTPTAIDTDSSGRVWVLENNTHFRPKNYDGPLTDRVLILDDFGPDGHARRISVFADGFRDGMGLRLQKDGSVIVSTRAETFRLRDTKGSGKADEKVTLLKLETKDDYPHNGLSGIALDGAGHLFVGLGENHGQSWVLTGSDGSVIRGSDEGGIFRADVTGAKLERWAKGIWNPFGLTVDDTGLLFALDNDPGAGSFCRLLHVVQHGDYGYRYRYGRVIDHPFLSWFGQIPGTLPPVCLVGEAPTGILQYHGSSLPSEYRAQLLGCTWNDHGIQRFPLAARGGSFISTPQWFVRGGNDFRPSGIAQASDGSLFISDWVDGAYEVHGKGRIWRVRAKQPGTNSTATAANEQSTVREKAIGHLNGDPSLDPKPTLHTDDPFLLHLAIEHYAADEPVASLEASVNDPDAKTRLGILLAYRRSGKPEGLAHLPQWLSDSDGSIRRAALQWISEEHLSDLQPKLETALSAPLSRATLEAYLAAIQMLVSGRPDSKATISQTRAIALDKSKPAELRALALRLLPVDSNALAADAADSLLQDSDSGVRLQTLRILAARTDSTSQTRLRNIACDTAMPNGFRAEAVAGLSASADSSETREILHQLLTQPDATLRNEALRALRGRVTTDEFTALRSQAAGDAAPARDLREQLMLQTRVSPAVQNLGADAEFVTLATSRPQPNQPWPSITDGKGDAAAGRRLFYHAKGPRCYTCHTIEGRGGAVGPDLTGIGRLSEVELLTAIREPSKDIAPAFTQWLLKLKDGREVSGIDAFEDNKSQIVLIDAGGGHTRYNISDIVSREPLPISMMPPGLDTMMTEQEIRDLLAYLREPRD